MVIHCGKIVLKCHFYLLLCCLSIKSTLEYWRLLSIKLQVSQSFFSCLWFCIKQTHSEALVLQSLWSPQAYGCPRQPTHKSPLQKGLLRSRARQYSLSPLASTGKSRLSGELNMQRRSLFSYWMGYGLWYPEEYGNQQRGRAFFTSLQYLPLFSSVRVTFAAS